MLYLIGEEGATMQWAYDAGIRDADELAWVRSLRFPVGIGLFGRSVSERRAIATDDYRTDDRFVHSPLLDRFVEELDVRSMVVAPLLGANGPIGALGAFTREAAAFDEASQALLVVLAQHAALAIDNAELIDQLAGSREALARRASEERSLREIAARITAIRDPSVIARQVVDESHRLLGSDVALLALVDGGEIHSAVVEGDLLAAARRAIDGQHLRIRGSLLEGAVAAQSAMTAADYLTDVVGREEGHNVAMAELLDIRGVAVAPLRVDERVVGLLGVWNHRPRQFGRDELDLLQGMADVAAIAVDSARLTAGLRLSEERYRFLIERAPELIWQVDGDERFVFINDRAESLLGWRADELIGTSVFDLIHPEFHRRGPAALVGQLVGTGRPGTNLPVQPAPSRRAGDPGRAAIARRRGGWRDPGLPGQCA